MALLYVRAWVKSSFAGDTSFNDFKVLPNMLVYWKFNCDIADAAFNKLVKHQWYLPEEAVVFPFCSDIPVVTNLMLHKVAERILSMQSFQEFRREIRLLQRTIKFIYLWQMSTALIHGFNLHYRISRVVDSMRLPLCVHYQKITTILLRDATETSIKLDTSYVAICLKIADERARILQEAE